MSEEGFFRSVGGVPISRGAKDVTWYFGWIPQDPDVEALLQHREPPTLFADRGATLLGSGAGRTVLLYEAVRQVWGRDLDLGPQRIGDCVSWAWAGCVDLLACVEVVAGDAEQHSWELRTCTEAVYGLSRVEYGNFDGSYQDGSFGRWAAEAVLQGGTMSRQRLGPYDPRRAKQWGARGLPDEFESEAAQHKVVRAALVLSFEEARDAIANGYPVAVCSNQGFRQVRDSDGFAAPRGSWAHCMKFIASRDDRRPGLLCMNSWGEEPNSVSGPKGEHDIPNGSFWVDASVCTHMFRSWRDSYALSNFEGYPSRVDKLKALFR